MLRRRVQAAFAVVLTVAVAAGVFIGVDYYRYRFVRTNGDLVKLLPPGDETVFFADLKAMRQAGVLRLLAEVKPAEEEAYDQFLRETQFDFVRDLEALAGAYDANHLYLTGRGKFDWDKLQSYAAKHGGACREDSCRQAGSTPGKWVNFIRVQPNVLALAVSGERTAADVLRPPGRRVQGEVPGAPIWVTMSRALLTNPAKLPGLVQMFAIAVQSGDGVTLAVEPVQGGAEVFEIRLRAEFENAAAADTARAQLAIQTRTLKAALEKDEEKADAANLAGMLTSGWFQASGKQLTGAWPVRREFLATLQ